MLLLSDTCNVFCRDTIVKVSRINRDRIAKIVVVASVIHHTSVGLGDCLFVKDNALRKHISKKNI